MKNFIKAHKAILFLSLLFAIIFITNFRPGTYLLGWDSLSTELNPALGIKRAFFSVWQEYQSLGLVAGMAHAADLVRAVLIYLLSFVLPESIVRYVFTMGMIYSGMMGTFYLFRHIFKQAQIRFMPFAGALFYLLNFNIIQMFFLPFEAFSVFAAVLPWNVLIFIKTLENGLTKRNLVYILAVFILSTPAFVAQQLFVVYGLIFFLVAVGLFIQKRSFSVLKRAVLLAFIVIITNSFWILPQAYFVLDNGNVTKTSKISQLSTTDVFYRNKDKGNIQDFLSNTGFFYESNGINQQPLFATWKAYREFPFIQFFIFSAALIVIIGLFPRSPYRLAFTLPIILITVALLNNTPPFLQLNELLRENSFINQMFRSPFTKFAVPYALFASYFFAVGLGFLALKTRKIHMHYVVIGLGIFFVIMQGFPALTGQYISKEMNVSIPQEYKQMFEHFKSVDKNKRIALLPDYTHWGWYYQSWGYNGSGFLWYGIEQPIVSRNFDMWSTPSESYFWEAKEALEKEDITSYNNILKKYDVDYVVLDESAAPVITSMKAIQYDRLKKALSSNEFMKLEKKWGFLSVYKVVKPEQSKDFVSYTSPLPNVGPKIAVTNKDTAFEKLGTYKTINSKPFDTYFPFLDFTTQTQMKNKTWEIHEFPGSFQIVKQLEFNPKNYTLSTASGEFTPNLYINGVPVSFSMPYTISLNDKTVSITFPKVLLNEFDLTSEKPNYCWSENGKLTSKNQGSSIIIDTRNGAAGCISYDLKTIDQRYGYLAAISNKNIEGQRLFFYVIDQTKSQPYVEDRLTSDIHYYVLANRYTEGVGYSFSFQSNSLKTVPSVNTLERLAVYIIPYDIIKNVSLSNKNAVVKVGRSMPLQAQKINYYTYKAVLPKNASAEMLTLAQSYNSGWKAYVVPDTSAISTLFPFLKGKELPDHVLINNWKNGWNIKNTQETLVVMFVPQYLQFAGFALLGLLSVGVAIKLLRK